MGELPFSPNLALAPLKQRCKIPLKGGSPT